MIITWSLRHGENSICIRRKEMATWTGCQRGVLTDKVHWVCNTGQIIFFIFSGSPWLTNSYITHCLPDWLKLLWRSLSIGEENSRYSRILHINSSPLFITICQPFVLPAWLFTRLELSALPTYKHRTRSFLLSYSCFFPHFGSY